MKLKLKTESLSLQSLISNQMTFGMTLAKCSSSSGGKTSQGNEEKENNLVIRTSSATSRKTKDD